MYPVGCSKNKRERHTLVTRSGTTSVPQKKVLENIPTVATSKPSWYRHLEPLGTKELRLSSLAASSWRAGATGEIRPCVCLGVVGTRLGAPWGQGLCIVPLGTAGRSTAGPPPSPAQRAVTAHHWSPCLLFSHRYAFSTQYPGPRATWANQSPYSAAQHPSTAPSGPTTKSMFPSSTDKLAGLVSFPPPDPPCVFSPFPGSHIGLLPAPHSYPLFVPERPRPHPVTLLFSSPGLSSTGFWGEPAIPRTPEPTRSHPGLSPPCSPPGLTTVD